MASGTGERPLPDINQEKGLMGISGLRGAYCFEVPNSATRYLVFPSGYKGGLLVTGSYSTSYNKFSLYILQSGSTQTLQLSDIKVPTQSGVTITATNNTVITITNSASGYLWGGVLMFFGSSPTLETTLPS